MVSSLFVFFPPTKEKEKKSGLLSLSKCRRMSQKMEGGYKYELDSVTGMIYVQESNSTCVRTGEFKATRI